MPGTAERRGDMDRVSGGVIGVGPMGARQARPLSHRPGARGLAWMDADGERRARAPARCGTEWAYAHALIRRPRLDAVLMAAPDAKPAALTQAGAEAGQPVFVEKPLGLAAVAAMRVVDAARAGATPDARGLQAGIRPGPSSGQAGGAARAPGSRLALHGAHYRARGRMADAAVQVCAASVPCPVPAGGLLLPRRFSCGAAGVREYAAGGYQADIRRTQLHGYGWIRGRPRGPTAGPSARDRHRAQAAASARQGPPVDAPLSAAPALYR